MSFTLAEPRKVIIAGGRRQITSRYKDGAEEYEEYDVVTDELLLRKRRQRNHLDALSEWVTEVGLDPSKSSKILHQSLIVESSSSPIFVPQDTKDAHVFRIRNFPYSKETVLVTIEKSSQDRSSSINNGEGSSTSVAEEEIVVRTTNKKYFKRIGIPLLKRLGIPLDPTNLSYDVKLNTLVITYKKPVAVLLAEEALRKERLSIPAQRKEENQGCPPQ